MKHRIDVKKLSIKHLEGQISTSLLLESYIRKPVAERVAYRQAREKAEAELARRLRSTTKDTGQESHPE